MNVREVTKADSSAWLRMRNELWPADPTEHEAEIGRYFDIPDPGWVTFVAEENDGLLGFLELEHRKYAPGCRSSPVPFIEGWYVDSVVRGRGVGRALVEAAEDWARAAGHVEIASDAEIDNADSIAAHVALGYEEVERAVCFRRSLRDS